MFDQYDVYENGMGLSGRGGGGGEKNTSRRKIWQQQKKKVLYRCNHSRYN